MPSNPEIARPTAAWVPGREIGRRRAFVIRMISGCAAATALFFAVFYVVRGESSVFEFVFAVIAGSAVLFALVIPIAARSYVAAAVYFVALCFFVFVAVSLESGRNDGTHYFLLVIGPVLPLLFGARRPWVVAILASLSVAIFLALEFTLPALIYHNRPWLPQIRNPFAESLDIDPDDIIFAVSMFAFEGILSAATFASVRMAERAEAALEREFGRSEMLLASLLPASVAARLKDRPEAVIADHLPAVTVLFADIVGFTDRAANGRPREVVDFLGRVFAAFDELAERHGMEKIKTIGDSYMAVGGIAGNGGHAHAVAAAEMALGMMEACDRFSREGGEAVALRIGMSSGPAIAGVIGRRKPFFDVWGDTINMAARMESTGLPGRIQTTASVADLLRDRYIFEERGRIDVKGKGSMTVHFLVGRAT